MACHDASQIPLLDSVRDLLAAATQVVTGTLSAVRHPSEFQERLIGPSSANPLQRRYEPKDVVSTYNAQTGQWRHTCGNKDDRDYYYITDLTAFLRDAAREDGSARLVTGGDYMRKLLITLPQLLEIYRAPFATQRQCYAGFWALWALGFASEVVVQVWDSNYGTQPRTESDSEIVSLLKWKQLSPQTPEYVKRDWDQVCGFFARLHTTLSATAFHENLWIRTHTRITPDYKQAFFSKAPPIPVTYFDKANHTTPLFSTLPQSFKDVLLNTRRNNGPLCPAIGHAGAAVPVQGHAGTTAYTKQDEPSAEEVAKPKAREYDNTDIGTGSPAHGAGVPACDAAASMAFGRQLEETTHASLRSSVQSPAAREAAITDWGKEQDEIALQRQMKHVLRQQLGVSNLGQNNNSKNAVGETHMNGGNSAGSTISKKLQVKGDVLA